jgi:pimeloyl-ACP methyl ester carboxylesterase
MRKRQPMNFKSQGALLVHTAAVFLLLLSSYTVSSSQQAPQGFKIPEIAIDMTEKMVDVGGRSIHCRLFGAGSPTVVLVSGFNAVQENWNAVIPPLAESATVVTYDRAGYGKSEIGELPTHAEQSARDLNILLKKLDVPKPYVLVGHSYGVRVVRMYASMFPETIGGMVWMDGQHPDILKAQLSVLTGDDRAQLERMVAMWKPKENPRIEADYAMTSLDQDRKIQSLPQVPTILISAGAGRERGLPPGLSSEAQEKLVKLGLEMQKKLLDGIPGGRLIQLNDVSHFMHLEKPGPVIEIILSMVAEVKKTAK